MARVLVTGMSGTGKSTALAELARRGFEVVDTDEGGWTEWSQAEGGYVWREDRIRELLARDRARALYVSGTVSNQGRFRRDFDAVALLSAPADVLLGRVAARTTNDYGKTAAERELILRHLAEVEPLLRATCTHEVDATLPVESVVERLVAIGRNAAALPHRGRHGASYSAAVHATLLDLQHMGVRKAVGAFLLPTDDGLALVDCGPSSTLHVLEHELRARGRSLGDLRHLLLTHIHLDHAGAAGVIVRRNPELRVHVSEIGAPHLTAPDRLERSARRLYGEAFDQLWGELAPVPEENIDVLSDEALGLDVFPAPGHATHQVCFLDRRDGTAYPGDAAGVRIEPGRHVVPYAPPPDIDVEAWHATLDELEEREPSRLALPHFGFFDDVGEHVRELRARLDVWARRVADGHPIEQFVAEAEADLAAAGEADVDYFSSHSPWVPSYLGLARYWARRRDAA